MFSLESRTWQREINEIALASVLSISGVLLSATMLWADSDLNQLKAKYRRPTEIPFPASNPYTPEKAALGKALYFDPRLSGNQNMNCASCHNPSFGWEVPLKGAIGSQNTMLGRNAPTVLNQAWGGPHFFWDGRASSLEEQAKGPIQADVEMNLPLKEAVNRFRSIPEYQAWFEKVFPKAGVTGDNIVAAIATFERTLVSGYAPFDAWVDGDDNAISESAKRGFALFNGKANCSVCHVGWNFTDNKFHDIGLAASDIGRGKIDPDNVKAKYAFKTPSLRDISQRAPFMHDGSLPDLEAVMAHYVTNTIDRPSRSPNFRPVILNAPESGDVIEFMKSLTGTRQVVSLPVLPN
jgi:cytochrome c peroxidase